MNIKKLEVGMAIKNYKELCEVIDIEFKEGTCSRKSQFKELERYVSFHKQGQKIIIDEIYEEVKDKMDKRGGNNNIDYIKYIEKLILDLLMQSYHKENVCLSKNKLLKELKMINENYAFCKMRIPKLSKFTNIEKETIDEFYASSDSTLQGNLEKALNNLKNQSLIFWSNEISVCKIDVQTQDGNFDINKKITYDEYDEEIVQFKVNAFANPNFREATDKEKQQIIYVEREVMEDMGFRSKKDIVASGMWYDFKDMVNSIVLKDLNIDYYYNSYKLIWNYEHIIEKYEEILDDLLLSEEERKATQEILNNAIVNRLNSNIEKKHKRAINEVEESFGEICDKLERRTSNHYVKDNNKLTDTLINMKEKNIKNKIKKTKLNKND